MDNETEQLTAGQVEFRDSWYELIDSIDGQIGYLESEVEQFKERASDLEAIKRQMFAVLKSYDKSTASGIRFILETESWDAGTELDSDAVDEWDRLCAAMESKGSEANAKD